MKLSNKVVLSAVFGLPLVGCWGSDYKIGDVARGGELTAVTPVPTLEPTSLGLTPCQDRLEIETYASLEGTHDCAGRPCVFDKVLIIGASVAVGITYDGSNLNVIGQFEHRAYFGKVQRGKVHRLSALGSGPLDYLRAERDLVAVGEPDGDAGPWVSSVYRFGAAGPERVVTVQGRASRITSSAAGFAVRGFDRRCNPHCYEEFAWLSRHDASGTTLFRQEFLDGAHWNDVALGAQGTLFEYRVKYPDLSSLVRYDAAGGAQAFATIRGSYRQSAAAGPNDELVVATAQLSPEGSSDSLGVRAYDRAGSPLWSFEGLVPIDRAEEVRTIIAQNGDAYVATGFYDPGTSHAVLGVLRFSPAGEVCMAGSWTFEQQFQGPVGLVETNEGIAVATPDVIGIVPKR